MDSQARFPRMAMLGRTVGLLGRFQSELPALAATPAGSKLEYCLRLPSATGTSCRSPATSPPSGAGPPRRPRLVRVPGERARVPAGGRLRCAPSPASPSNPRTSP